MEGQKVPAFNILYNLSQFKYNFIWRRFLIGCWKLCVKQGTLFGFSGAERQGESSGMSDVGLR
jgi:hypothetical protein